MRARLLSPPDSSFVLARIAALLSVSLAAPAAYAQVELASDNSQSFLVGGRAAGMGGAFTAIADDESGMFYNPAGLALASHSSLSLSVSLYGYVRSRIKGGLPGDQDAGYSDFNIIPSTFGSVKKLSDRYTIAFGVFSPSSLSYKDQRRTPDGSLYISSLNDETYWAGAAFAAKLSPRWSVGLAAFAIYHSVASENAVMAPGETPMTTFDSDGRTDTVPSFFEFRDSTKEKDYGAAFIAGAQFRPWEWLTIGASFQSDGYPFAGSTNYLNSTAENGIDPTGARLRIDETTYSSRLVMPARTAIGLALRPSPVFLVSLDVSARNALDQHVFDDQGNDHVVPGPDTYNVNVGIEAKPGGRLILRAGAFTNRSTTPVDVIAGQANHIDEYGATVGVGLVSEHSETSAGIVASTGSGDGYTIHYDQNSRMTVDAAVPAQHLRAYLFLGTSYRF